MGAGEQKKTAKKPATQPSSATAGLKQAGAPKAQGMDTAKKAGLVDSITKNFDKVEGTKNGAAPKKKTSTKAKGGAKKQEQSKEKAKKNKPADASKKAAPNANPKKDAATGKKAEAHDTTAVGEASADPLNDNPQIGLPPSYPTGAPHLIVDKKAVPNIELKKGNSNNSSSGKSTPEAAGSSTGE